MAAGYCNEKDSAHTCKSKYVSENGKDICVMCGEETPYDTDMHVDARECYVYGLGQCCYECYEGAWDK